MAKKKTVRKTKATTAPKAAPPVTKASTTKAASPAAKTTKTTRPAIQTNHNGELDVAALLSDPNHEPPTDDQLRKVKTGLTKRDLERYRKLLYEKRAEILGAVESLEADARSNTGAGISYEHMADTGSDNYEQEFTLGLMASERRLLAEIDDALMRLQQGVYGACLETARPIGKPRLDAKPWAKFCIEVAREKERRGLV